MANTKTWTTVLITKDNEFGRAAVAASHDPAVYPENGLGVSLGTYRSDTGDAFDICYALLNNLVDVAMNHDIMTVRVFTDGPIAVDHNDFSPIRVKTYQIDSQELSDPADPMKILYDMASEKLKQELAALAANAGKIVFDPDHPPFMAGQYVIAPDGKNFKIGLIDRVENNKARVWYDDQTMATEDISTLRLLTNARYINSTSLG